MNVNWKNVLSQIPLEICGYIQLRDKEASDQQMLAWGREIQTIIAEKTQLIMNDRVLVARELGVGVHLGMEDMSPMEARALVGMEVPIGLTIHNRVELAQQYLDSIDYVGVGPVFPTLTKADAKAVLGIEQLRIIQRASPVPVVAIGGISQENCAEVWKTGVDQIAICSAIMKANNPKQAALGLQNSGDKN